MVEIVMVSGSPRSRRSVRSVLVEVATVSGSPVSVGFPITAKRTWLREGPGGAEFVSVVVGRVDEVLTSAAGRIGESLGRSALARSLD